MVSYTICEQEEIRMRTMKRKGVFLGLMMLAAALALLLLFLSALAPIHAVAEGDRCSNCDEWLDVDGNDDGHFYICINPECSNYGVQLTAMEPHVREKVITNTVPATCTEDGYFYGYVYCKVCTKTLEMGIHENNPSDPAKGHDWGDWTADPDDGTSHYRVCKREGCGATETVAHTYTWTYVNDTTHKGVCECGAETTVEHVWNGSHWCGYPRKCKDCGEYYGEVLDHEYWYEYKTDEQHKINCYHCDGLFGREDHSGGTATCIAKAVCEKCKAEYGEYAAHKGGTATCTEKAVCEICGQEYGAPLDHDWATAWTQDDHTHYYACSRCTERKDEAPHSYSWTYVDDNTCKGECTCGATTMEAHYDRWASTCGRQPHCEKCDHDYGSIPEHEMWYEDRGESGHRPNCYHCDTYFFLESHTYGDWQDNGDGTHTGKCICGRTETEAHSGGTATCTKKAICEVCGQEYGETLRHDLLHVRAIEPTCTADGNYEYYYCQQPGCGMVFTDAEGENPTTAEAITRSALGHDWYPWVDACDGVNHFRSCKRGCGVTETVAHSGPVFSNCTERGICEICGAAYFDPQGHVWGDWQDNGEGSHTRTCQRINCRLEESAPHSGGTATCTEKATCETCGVEYGKPLGHDLIDHEAQAPTCTEIGWDAYQTCSRCDYTTYAEKKAQGHTEVIDPAVPATYTSTGLTEGKHCSVCNQVLVAQEVVPRLTAPEPVEWAHVHTPVTDAAVAATCTRSGLTAGSHCGACGEVLTKQRRTSALGHDFGAWTPAMAGTHSAICRRCGESSAVGCTLVELDGARACLVCGYAEGEARATVIAPASAAGDVPGGSLVIVKAETEKGKWLLMGFEKGGRLLNIRGQIRFSVPAEALAGAALPGMEISGGQAVFALTMDRETEVILVEMGQ